MVYNTYHTHTHIICLLTQEVAVKGFQIDYLKRFKKPCLSGFKYSYANHVCWGGCLPPLVSNHKLNPQNLGIQFILSKAVEMETVIKLSMVIVINCH